MLILSRKVGERLLLGNDIVITINRISGNRVTVGIEAPGSVKILREECPRYPEPFRPRTEIEPGNNQAQANAAG